MAALCSERSGRRCAPGVVDVAAAFRALKAVGYDGWISFEDFSTAEPLDQQLRNNLAYVKGVIRSLG